MLGNIQSWLMSLMPWQIIMLVWVALNLVTLFVYGKDKWAAIKQHQRTPENTLHWLAWAGGWFGALLGQAFFRHKTQKTSFRRWFYVSIIGNVFLYAALIWVYKVKC